MMPDNDGCLTMNIAMNSLDWMKHAPEFSVYIQPDLYMLLDYQVLKSKFHVGFWCTLRD